MIDALTGELAFYIAEDESVDLITALEKLYNSEFYGKLLNHDTLLYREGAGYLYEVYKESPC
jgi:hypothetical protein